MHTTTTTTYQLMIIILDCDKRSPFLKLDLGYFELSIQSAVHFLIRLIRKRLSADKVDEIK